MEKRQPNKMLVNSANFLKTHAFSFTHCDFIRLSGQSIHKPKTLKLNKTVTDENAL